VTTIDLSVATVEAAVTVPVTGLAAVAVSTPQAALAVSPSSTAAVQLQAMPGGPTVVAVDYDDWPPTDPQPNILYLRLAP
jgi:hypothetical protein